MKASKRFAGSCVMLLVVLFEDSVLSRVLEALIKPKIDLDIVIAEIDVSCCETIGGRRCSKMDELSLDLSTNHQYNFLRRMDEEKQEK